MPIEVQYTDHALERMQLRHLSPRMVRDALRLSHSREHYPDGTVLCHLQMGNETATVVYYPKGPKTFLVITVYYEN